MHHKNTERSKIENRKNKSNTAFEIYLKSDTDKTVVKFQHQLLGADTLRDRHFTHVSEFNPRNQEYLSTRSLLELKKDIEEKGQLKPIYVIKTEDGSFEVLDGSRRLNVAILLRIPLKAYVTDARLNEYQKQELTNSLNSGKPHSLIERGELYCKLMEKGVYKTQKDIANATGQGKSQVSLAITAFKLPEAIKDCFAEPTSLGRSQINKLNDIKNRAATKLSASQLDGFYDRLHQEIIPDEFEYLIEREILNEQESKAKISNEKARVAAVNAAFISAMNEKNGDNYLKISPKLKKANQELFDFLNKQFTHSYITEVNASFRIRLEEEYDITIGSLISDDILDEYYDDYQACLSEIESKYTDKSPTTVDQSEINVRVTDRIQKILDEELALDTKPIKEKGNAPTFSQVIRPSATETEKEILEAIFSVEPKPSEVVEGFAKLTKSQMKTIESLPLGNYIHDLINTMQASSDVLLASRNALGEAPSQHDVIDTNHNVIHLKKQA